MIEVNAHSDHDILSIKATGKLSKEDLDKIEPALKNFIIVTDHPHLIMILEDFVGWEEPAAFWKDLQLDSEYIGYFDRIAVVGEKKWQEWGTRLVNPIIKEEITYFPLNKADEAWDWLRSEH